eukprot:2519805-Alexandrium_andersonii.AAC.1
MEAAEQDDEYLIAKLTRNAGARVWLRRYGEPPMFKVLAQIEPATRERILVDCVTRQPNNPRAFAAAC